MPIIFKTGDLFEDPSEALVNTVNCVGVMGAGVALEFKKRWPENFREYRKLCDAGALRPGVLFIHAVGDLVSGAPKYLVNFPTKDHWRNGSSRSYIVDGLEALVEHIEALGISSIAMPPLGCGNGGLDWNDIRPLIVEKLGRLEGVDIVVYDPPGYVPPAPKVAATFERLLLLKAIDEAGGTEVHRAVWTLQDLGAAFNLEFFETPDGPFSAKLDTALLALQKAGIVSGYDVAAPVLTDEGRNMLASLSGASLERANGLLSEAAGRLPPLAQVRAS